MHELNWCYHERRLLSNNDSAISKKNVRVCKRERPQMQTLMTWCDYPSTRLYKQLLLTDRQRTACHPAASTWWRQMRPTNKGWTNTFQSICKYIPWTNTQKCTDSYCLKNKNKKGRRNWLPPSSLSVFAWNLIFKLDILKSYETMNMPVAGRTLSQYCVMRDTFKFIIVWK